MNGTTLPKIGAFAGALERAHLSVDEARVLRSVEEVLRPEDLGSLLPASPALPIMGADIHSADELRLPAIRTNASLSRSLSRFLHTARSAPHLLEAEARLVAVTAAVTKLHQEIEQKARALLPERGR